jgi:hypothetical protein
VPHADAPRGINAGVLLGIAAWAGLFLLALVAWRLLVRFA